MNVLPSLIPGPIELWLRKQEPGTCDWLLQPLRQRYLESLASMPPDTIDQPSNEADEAGA